MRPKLFPGGNVKLLMPRPGEPIGLIAGNGELPLCFARKAIAKGHPLFIAAVRGETTPAVERLGTKTQVLSVGQLGGLVSFFRKNGVKKAVAEGQIRHAHLFKNLRLDLKAATLLFRLKDRSGEALMRAVGDELSNCGTNLMDCRTFLDDLLATEGVLTKTKPSRDAAASITYGMPLAKMFASKAVGQTLVLKKSAVVAVEALEGTNGAILRAGKLAGEGTVVVKVASPNHDWRFDVPTLGPATVQALIKAKASGLVVEAGAAFLLQKEKTLALANQHGIFIQAVKRA
jgi:DUF1009 family protein